MFNLKKLKLEDGSFSKLPEGYESSLPSALLFNHINPNEKKEIDSIQELEKGYQLLLFSDSRFHRTSKIQEIVSKDDNAVVFRTQTSVYQLTQDTVEEDTLDV